MSWGLGYYRHADWLGSERLESGGTPNAVKQDVAYAPFGEPYSQLSGGNGEISFTGQNKDTDWLNYDFMYREYDPRQSRWISPDPAGTSVVNFSDPQSFNRYAYVENGPLNAVDPLGLACYAFEVKELGRCPIPQPSNGSNWNVFYAMDIPVYQWNPGTLIQPTVLPDGRVMMQTTIGGWQQTGFCHAWRRRRGVVPQTRALPQRRPNCRPNLRTPRTASQTHCQVY